MTYGTLFNLLQSIRLTIILQRLASLGIMGSLLNAPLENPQKSRQYGSVGLKGAFNWAPIIFRGGALLDGQRYKFKIFVIYFYFRRHKFKIIFLFPVTQIQNIFFYSRRQKLKIFFINTFFYLRRHKLKILKKNKAHFENIFQYKSPGMLAFKISHRAKLRNIFFAKEYFISTLSPNWKKLHQLCWEISAPRHNEDAPLDPSIR